MRYTYSAIIHKEDKTDFGVHFPELPGCFSVGSTQEEALEMAKDALLTYLEMLQEDNEPIPKPQPRAMWEEELEQEGLYGIFPVSVEL